MKNLFKAALFTTVLSTSVAYSQQTQTLQNLPSNVQVVLESQTGEFLVYKEEVKKNLNQATKYSLFYPALNLKVALFKLNKKVKDVEFIRGASLSAGQRRDLLLQVESNFNDNLLKTIVDENGYEKVVYDGVIESKIQKTVLSSGVKVGDVTVKEVKLPTFNKCASADKLTFNTETLNYDFGDLYSVPRIKDRDCVLNSSSLVRTVQLKESLTTPFPNLDLGKTLEKGLLSTKTTEKVYLNRRSDRGSDIVRVEIQKLSGNKVQFKYIDLAQSLSEFSKLAVELPSDLFDLNLYQGEYPNEGVVVEFRLASGEYIYLSLNNKTNFNYINRTNGLFNKYFTLESLK